MNTGILNVLRNSGDYYFTATRYSVHFQLFRILNELTHHNRIFSRHASRLGQESDKLLVVGRNGHRRAAKDIRRPDQAWIADPPGKRFRVLNIDQLSPFGLLDAELVQ